MRLCAALLALAGTLATGKSPAPAYLTFKGAILYFQQDDGGYAAARGIGVGDSVTYVFEVDTGSLGYAIRQGALITDPDTIKAAAAQSDVNYSDSGFYFFDSLLTPSLFSAPFSGSRSGAFCGTNSIAYQPNCIPIDPRYPTGACYEGPPRILYQTVLSTIVGEFGVSYLRDTTVDTAFGNGTTGKFHYHYYYPAKSASIAIYFKYESAPNQFLPSTELEAWESYHDGTDHTSKFRADLRLVDVSLIPPQVSLRPRRKAASLVRSGLRVDGLDLSGPEGSPVRTRIFDPSGRTWKDWRWSGHDFIPRQALPKGIFFVDMNAEGSASSIRAFVR